MPASPRSRSGAASNASPAEGATPGGSAPSGAAPVRTQGTAAAPDCDPAEVAPAAADPAAFTPATFVPAEATAAAAEPPEPEPEPEPQDGVDDLSFRDAQVALELVLSQLQAPDLDVEAMVRLHRRGQAYAERCDALLRQVEQEVRLWDPDEPDAEPRAYAPG